MSTHQYSLALIQHEVNNSVINQRESDGYINATAMCKVSNKQFKDYANNQSTKEFFHALSEDLKLEIQLADKSLVNKKQALIETFPGAPSTGGGTWVHPQVALNLAQWLSPKFAVQVSKWVHDWMLGKRTSSLPAQLPHHLSRYIANDGRVPAGYFSILQETGLSLFGPLHYQGFDVPKGWVPDISVGLKFCEYLRDEHNVDTDALPTYPHTYLDDRKMVNPKVYPDEFLAEFRKWFRTHWLPNYGVKYFKKKDPDSLMYLDKLPALAAPKSTPSLPKLK